MLKPRPSQLVQIEPLYGISTMIQVGEGGKGGCRWEMDVPWGVSGAVAAC